MLGFGRLKGLRRAGGLFGIDLVGGTKAGERCARGRKGRGKSRRIAKTLRGDGLDAAGLEKTPGKCCPRGELGRGAEIGEKTPWSRPLTFKYFAGSVAQPLEGHRKPYRRQRFELEPG